MKANLILSAKTRIGLRNNCFRNASICIDHNLTYTRIEFFFIFKNFNKYSKIKCVYIFNFWITSLLIYIHKRLLSYFSRKSLRHLPTIRLCLSWNLSRSENAKLKNQKHSTKNTILHLIQNNKKKIRNIFPT